MIASLRNTCRRRWRHPAPTRSPSVYTGKTQWPIDKTATVAYGHAVSDFGTFAVSQKPYAVTNAAPRRCKAWPAVMRDSPSRKRTHADSADEPAIRSIGRTDAGPPNRFDSDRPGRTKPALCLADSRTVNSPTIVRSRPRSTDRLACRRQPIGGISATCRHS